MPPSLNLDRLADQLTPVRRIHPAVGTAVATVAVLLVAACVLMFGGLRPDLAEGIVHPIFLIRGGLLLLLGSASLVAVMGMARPAVGRQWTGWRWAVAAAALAPVTAIILALNGPAPVASRLHVGNGAECLIATLIGGLAIGAALTLWLRRGAPTSPDRAGLLIGLASGSLAAFAYGLHCPHDDMVYIGLWYSLGVAAAALLGRLIIPRLLRW